MLKNKEIADHLERDANQHKLEQMQHNKRHIQRQIDDANFLRQQAHEEYLREKSQVDAVVCRMIEEDNEQARIVQQKKEQSQADMILSQNEKRALFKRQREMDEYEDEMVRRYAQQQQSRQDEIQSLKAQAEQIRDQIFQKLASEEELRAAEKMFQEQLRNELYVQEGEEAAQAKERAEAEKRVRVREELQAAREYQLRLKAERAEEEKRMEEDFKRKLLEKFAEDDRLEQMNAQKRRMRELEHKREIERLWQEKLVIYKAQREAEQAEQEFKAQEEDRQRVIIAEEKARLLAEHAAIL